MWGVGSDLNGILVTLMVILEDEGRDLCLLNKTFRCATAQIDNPSKARARRDVCHVQHVLDDVKHEVVLLFKTRGGNSNRNAAIGDGRTKDRHSRFICRGKNAIFRGNLRSEEHTSELQSLAYLVCR